MKFIAEVIQNRFLHFASCEIYKYKAIITSYVT